MPFFFFFCKRVATLVIYNTRVCCPSIYYYTLYTALLVKNVTLVFRVFSVFQPHISVPSERLLSNVIILYTIRSKTKCGVRGCAFMCVRVRVCACVGVYVSRSVCGRRWSGGAIDGVYVYELVNK